MVDRCLMYISNKPSERGKELQGQAVEGVKEYHTSVKKTVDWEARSACFPHGAVKQDYAEKKPGGTPVNV